MSNKLQGKTIAFLATDGVEQVELTKPWEAVERAGGNPKLVSLKGGRIQGVNGSNKGDTFPVDQTIDGAMADDYDGLVLPGGVANPDHLRMNEKAVQFVRTFFDQGKPVAAICHGPWTLIDAEVVRGRTLTSYPSLHKDLENAGAHWVDEEVHVDQGLVTSRNPSDLPAFCKKAVEEFAEGVHSGQRQPALSATGE
jgi:protease I